MQIFGDRIKVGRYEDQPDYTAEITATFEKFRQGVGNNYLVRLSSTADMNYLEAGVLDLVARLHPAPFAALGAFAAQHQDFIDPILAAFDREVQFYLAYADFLAPLEKAGLRFCHPQLSDTSKEVAIRGTVDLALAAKLVPDHPVVANDVTLTGGERILVVTGPNQGGKTTLARAIGQLHHLARLGCPVPGTEARLMLADEILTHFERGENLGDLRGKLEDELVRVHEILRRATSDSLVILNEIFASTTLQDGVFLGTLILRKLIQLNCISVCVTFLDELSAMDAAVVSMVSTAKPDDPSVRTFKVVRRPADGLAHANAIAEKYGLSYQRVRARLAR
jgi:DNA mismatch repair ATPase MutS